MGIDEYIKLEGIEIGREEKGRKVVENLLRETDFTKEKISTLADVSIEFVDEVRESLKGGQI
jgi:hypothetical protein